MAMMMVSFLVSTYYNVIISWAVIYLFSAFASEVPWKNCDKSWASDLCRLVIQSAHEFRLFKLNICPLYSTRKLRRRKKTT